MYEGRLFPPSRLLVHGWKQASEPSSKIEDLAFGRELAALVAGGTEGNISFPRARKLLYFLRRGAGRLRGDQGWLT